MTGNPGSVQQWPACRSENLESIEKCYVTYCGCRGTHWCSNMKAEAFSSYLGGGFWHKILDYPLFDLRLFKRCLQRTAPIFRGSWDAFSIRVHLQSTETSWDWGLAGLIPCPEESHQYRWFEWAPSYWSWAERHRCVAVNCLIRQKDDTRRWLRQPFGNVFLLLFHSIVSQILVYWFWCVKKHWINGFFYLDQTARMEFRVF